MKKQGDRAVKDWIDRQLKNTSVTVVLIGSETSNRPYVQYEIKKSYEALTASGLIRTLWVKGDTPGLAQLAEALKRDGVDPDLWASDPHDKRIYLDPANEQSE